MKKLYLIGWLLVTIINTLIVLNDNRMSRMLLLVIVVVLQHITLLLVMYDFERQGREQWAKKEKRLREEFKDQFSNQGA